MLVYPEQPFGYQGRINDVWRLVLIRYHVVTERGGTPWHADHEVDLRRASHPNTSLGGACQIVAAREVSHYA